MSKFTELIDTISSKDSSPEKMHELTEVLDEVVTKMHKAHPELYNWLMEELCDLAYSISQEEAEMIVRRMTPKGQNWSYTAVKDFVEKKGITSKVCEWYLVMNMVYNDFYNTAKMYGLQNDVEFYYNLARDFIMDPDAAPHKVQKYFLH